MGLLPQWVSDPFCVMATLSDNHMRCNNLADIFFRHGLSGHIATRACACYLSSLQHILGQKGRTMKITVTQKHIENGRRLSPSLCPIARAIRDHYGRVGDNKFVANIGTQVASLWDLSESGNPSRQVYALPVEAKEFSMQFDRGCDVQPFEFELGRDYAS